MKIKKKKVKYLYNINKIIKFIEKLKKKYENFTVEKLKAELNEKNIEIPKNAKKSELIEILCSNK
jgi:hypothetical protein